MSLLAWLLFRYNAPTYKIITAPQLSEYLSLVKEMRVRYYKQYPYLYTSPSVVKEDVSYYNNSSSSVLILEYQHSKLIGLIIGLPLKDFKAQQIDFLGAYQKMNPDLKRDQTFYISELSVMPGNDEYKAFQFLIRALEQYLKSRTHFSALSVMAVERQDNHPLQPSHYQSESHAYADLGFIDSHGVYPFQWPTVQADGSIKNQTNDMRLWVKSIF
jgi:hypothetical protein